MRRIGGDANWFALRPRFDALVAATRAGEDTLAGWHALEADIARLVAAELDQTIRHGEFEDESFPGPTAMHQCPRALCDRVLPATPDRPPACPLFGVAMSERA
ncbi:hypothetical protein [Amycolatopsis pretoriensis]|uniref:hypothetical protein n=1 Tax=Amycolatopsis pretoriensis TaxID=218821 RepID=UPI00115FF6E1|nr:hypothetical protein [Amycolatopsis pretoriensis]